MLIFIENESFVINLAISDGLDITQFTESKSKTKYFYLWARMGEGGEILSSYETKEEAVNVLIDIIESYEKGHKVYRMDRFMSDELEDIISPSDSKTNKESLSRNRGIL